MRGIWGQSFSSFYFFYAAIQHKVAFRAQLGDEKKDAVQQFTDRANTEQERQKLEGSVQKTITCKVRTTTKGTQRILIKTKTC